MLKFVGMALAALVLSVTAASASPDAKSGEVCVLGKGKAVCCKTFKPNHDVYVSCCEVGNRGFFTATECVGCPMQKELNSAPPAAACGAKASVSCAAGAGHACDSETGNRGFFKNSASTCSLHTAACCASKK